MKRISRGHCLPELLIAMSACGVIMSMTTVLLHRVLHAHQSSRKCLDVERTAFRLANTFRNDVHATTDMAIGSSKEDDKFLCRLSPNSAETIEYRTIAKVLERRTMTKDKIVATDTFDFPTGSKFVVARDSLNIVTITVSPPSWGKDRSQRIAATAHLNVSALLGRDSGKMQEKRQERAP